MSSFTNTGLVHFCMVTFSPPEARPRFCVQGNRATPVSVAHFAGCCTSELVGGTVSLSLIRISSSAEGTALCVPLCPVPTVLDDTQHSMPIAVCGLGPKSTRLKQCLGRLRLRVCRLRFGATASKAVWSWNLPRFAAKGWRSRRGRRPTNGPRSVPEAGNATRWMLAVRPGCAGGSLSVEPARAQLLQLPDRPCRAQVPTCWTRSMHVGNDRPGTGSTPWVRGNPLACSWGASRATFGPRLWRRRGGKPWSSRSRTAGQVLHRQMRCVWLIRHADLAGVLVMTSGAVANSHCRLDPAEFRGFALADPMAPLAFINGADAKAVQMLTLVHELAHLRLGMSALSDAGAKPVQDSRNEETWRHAVAAEVLVPLDVLQGELRHDESLPATVSRCASTFKVSGPVVLRRLLDAGWIDRRTFDAQWCEEGTHVRSHAQGDRGGDDFYKTTVARVSRRFAPSPCGQHP